MNTFDRIDARLKELGKEQRELTDYLNVPQSLYSMWKSGKVHSYMKRINQIADFLGVSTDYLLGKDNIKNRSTFDNAELNVELETLINDILNLPPSQIEKVRDYVDFLMSQRKFSDNK